MEVNTLFEVISGWFSYLSYGVIYLFASILIVKCFLGKKNNDFTKVKKIYYPYITIIVIFISYLLGWSIHLASEKVWSFLSSNFNTIYNTNVDNYINHNMSQANKARLDSSYVTLIMLRHLKYSTYILGFCLLIWFRKCKKYRKGLVYFFVCLFFGTIFTLAYSLHKPNYLKIKNEINKAHYKEPNEVKLNNLRIITANPDLK